MSDLTPLMPPKATESDIGPESRSLDSFVDLFTEDAAAGDVIKSRVTGLVIRKGVDREACVSIDNGALRFQPLIRPGWGRCGIAYGPFQRQNGLGFAAYVLNGHNISRTQRFPDGFRERLSRWISGSETDHRFRRLCRWILGRQKRFFWRRLRHWFRNSTSFFEVPTLDENLAVGWFPNEAPSNPLATGNGFLVHSVVSDGGELWAKTRGKTLRTVSGLQNLPAFYLIVLREKGAAHYTATISRGDHMTSSSGMRIVAIDPFADESSLYAGVQQSVLGEIGFRVDTRVYRTQVASVAAFRKWFGSAHGADALGGCGSLESTPAEIGGNWKSFEGKFGRTEFGAMALEASNLAILQLEGPVGLISLLIETDSQPLHHCGIVWRVEDEHNYWAFEMDADGCHLSLKENGRWNRFPVVESCAPLRNKVNSMQVFDDGENLRLYLNGDLVYGSTLSDTRLANSMGVGIIAEGNSHGRKFQAFEAHPREIPIPNELRFEASIPRRGSKTHLADDFRGIEGVDLASHVANVGQAEWRRELGKGSFALTGANGAKVVASAAQPCPGRTAYTLPWANAKYADLEVTITTPLPASHRKERGRGGLIFWQDANNYITLNLWHDDTGVFSASSFFRVDGFEELYDAVWTNIGRRVQLGVPFQFNVILDHERFLVSINGEPVLYRALTDVYPDWKSFDVRRVGILANWEWGNDTGSVFQNFLAKDLA